MSGSKTTPPPDQAAPGDDKPEEKKSGRVTFDARGNAVWEWSMSTGVFGRDVDTKRLKKLEANDLKIEDDAPPPKTEDDAPPKTKGLSLKPSKQPGGGFDPYNSSGSGRGPGPGRKQPQKPRDLKRLSEWIQLQKNMGKKPDEE